MITKEQFVHYIDIIKTLMEKADMLNDALQNFDECSDFSGFSNFRAINALVELLEDIFHEDRSVEYPTNISYFIYDLEFGSKWTEDSIWDENENSIDISTPEKLYDYLIENLKSR